MRYLKLKRCDGIYDYYPLEITSFGFVETDDHEYRVEIRCGNRCAETIFEKKYIYQMDKCMIKIANIPDGKVVDVQELF
jgi:hypothetical protein